MAERFVSDASQYIDKINAQSFDNIALELFRYQHANNSIYRSFCDILGVNAAEVNSLTTIPYLPISFFKTHEVVTGSGNEPEIVFESSRTTGDNPSRHSVFDPALYRETVLKGFKAFYGAPEDYCILALLPSYLERSNASLVYMAKMLMDCSGHRYNGFYLNEWEKLQATIDQLEQERQPTLLLGVTFALLDFAEAYRINPLYTKVMETGGMKGRKEEQTREQVHNYLMERWHLSSVHSEYGMTELLSQAYSAGSGEYRCISTMKVLIRDLNDPTDVTAYGSGCLNIIDLANVDSCAFIATEDLGAVQSNGMFKVFGRMDNTMLRGCSLMTA